MSSVVNLYDLNVCFGLKRTVLTEPRSIGDLVLNRGPSGVMQVIFL